MVGNEERSKSRLLQACLPSRTHSREITHSLAAAAAALTSVRRRRSCLPQTAFLPAAARALLSSESVRLT